MSFISAEYFWLFLFLAALIAKKDFRGFSFRAYGYVITFVFIILALTRPVILQEPVKKELMLSDVIVAVDLSFSMQARDLHPSRLIKAKETLKSLIKAHKNSRFGVIGFTTNAIILSPLTQDRELLEHLFGSLDENMIVTKGSSIMSALKLSRKMSKSKKLSVVILSDGADETGYTNEAQFAKERGLVVNIFMLASKMGDSLVLAGGEFLKDTAGNIVVSRENEAIKEISEATDGVYTKSFDELLDALESQRSQDERSEQEVVENIELFYYFVFLAIVAFLVSNTTLKRYVLAFLLLFGVSLDANFLDYFADKNIKEFKTANAYYKSGEFESALSSYEAVKSSDPEFKAIVFYNMANSLVKLKEYERAKEAYMKSLTLSYSKEADENMRYIRGLKEQKQASSKNNSKKTSLSQEKKKKKKEGGGSNMNVSASSGSSDTKDAKKVSAQTKIDLNSNKTKLSSRAYELINKRQIDEKQPW
ncbi:MAG: VWA domain-containing protein [Sulfurimonas sp.]|uniref:VWA domain-containing protein n=1 Tax=Sulfurimonas sp. TaxID=2022749 RepID=UPI0025F71644|nr:VWA domain-containing protein [Sulfurimonas sp.]MCK9491441.1 VWA domain-containing protein [Sulfurimonas sp.]